MTAIYVDGLEAVDNVQHAIARELLEVDNLEYEARLWRELADELERYRRAGAS